jgi:hypothetical protein
MNKIRENSAADDLGSQARFVAAARRDRPVAWQCVEMLRAACAVPPTLTLLPESAATMAPLIA